MTQALNLANFANNLNTSGATTNAGLQNSSVTVTAGTGMSGGGAVALGNSVTLTNAGVTSFNGSTGAVTVAIGSGTVTSVATGNGLTGGTITTSGTLSLDFYTGTTYNNTSYPVGSYLMLGYYTNPYSQVALNNTMGTFYAYSNWTAALGNSARTDQGFGTITAISGTWKCRGQRVQNAQGCCPPANAFPILMQRTA